MAEETLSLILPNDLSRTPASYVIDFSQVQRLAGGIRYRLGHNMFSGPVALKTVQGDGAATSRLQRELEVSRFLGSHGGELISKCLGYNFDEHPAHSVVTFRGRSLSALARDQNNWPPADTHRRKIIKDLLQALALLELSGIVHGAIGMNTLQWDDATLQIVDFGQAALCGEYPDGRAAHHGDDIEAAGRVIYQVHTGEPAPDDPVALRAQLEDVHDAALRDLLLRRDLVAGVDIDYVFAAEPDRRPTAGTLLARLQQRPRGVQWEHLVARDAAVREDFRRLRERQRSFRVAYRQWAAAEAAKPHIPEPRAADPDVTPAPRRVPPRPIRPRPVRPGTVPPDGEFGRVYGRRPTAPWWPKVEARTIAAIAVMLGILFLVVVACVGLLR